MNLGEAARHALLSVCLLAVLSGACRASDTVTFSPPPSAPIGILLDGSMGGANVSDRAYTANPGGPINVGSVTLGSHNEIVAFQEGRPVALKESVGWTPGDDTVPITFSNEMAVPLKIWLLEGLSSTRYNRAVGAALTMAAIWQDERLGLKLGNVAMEWNIAAADANPFLNFKCTGNCPEARNLRAKIGHQAGVVNIYYVDMVDFGDGMSRGNGVWCDDDTIVLGSMTWGALLAHEFGHALALFHVDTDTTNFDETNVMHSLSDTRRYLTEGQSYRAHLEPASVINVTTSYNFRPGLTTRPCGNLSNCPVLEKRIWADGTFPPN